MVFDPTPRPSRGGAGATPQDGAEPVSGHAGTIQTACYEGVVDQGNAYFQSVLELDRSKHSGRADIIAKLNALVADFVGRSGLPLRVGIGFCDVHALMQRRSHTELCFVRMNGLDCTLLFHDRLFEFTDPFAGFIFVGKVWVFLMVLAAFVADHRDAVAEFTVELGDVATLDQVSFSSTHPGACLILDFDFATLKGYSAYRELCRTAPVPWDERHDKVFWRGSTTGGRLHAPPAEGEPDSLTWLARLQLLRTIQAGALNPLCDVGITDIVQIPEPHLARRLERSGLMRPRVPRQDFMNAKAVFDIDGNANAWSGLFCSLLGGSCVLKVASRQGFRQWYYDRLIPWLHFVPIQADLADLPDRVDWVLRHDAEARQIAARGRALAEGIDLPAAVRNSADNLRAWLRRR